jgi:hypothetical protein
MQNYEMSEVPIKWEGKETSVTVRELSFMEIKEAQQAATTLKTFGTQMQASFDQKTYDQMILIKGITKAPFAVNPDNLRLVRYKDGIEILRIIKVLTGLEEDEKKTLKGKSEPDNSGE